MVRMEANPSGRAGGHPGGGGDGFGSNLGVRNAQAHKRVSSAVAWSANGEKLFVAGDNTSIRVYDSDRLACRDPNAERETSLFSGHDGKVEKVVPCPHDKNLFVSGGCDAIVNLYDIRAGPKPKRTLSVDGSIIDMCWSKDDGASRVVVGSTSNTLYVVNPETWKVEKEERQKVEVNEMAFHKSGKILLLALGDGRIQICDWPSLKTLGHVQGHRARCFSLAVDPSGRRLAVSSEDQMITIWNAATMMCEFTIDRSTFPIRLLDFSFDGRYLASATSNGGVDVFIAANGGKVCTHQTQGLVVRDLKWHPKRNLFAYCAEPVAGAPPPRPFSNANTGPQPKSRAYIYGYPVPISGRLQR